MEDITEGGQGMYVHTIISSYQNLLKIIFIIIFISKYNYFMFLKNRKIWILLVFNKCTNHKDQFLLLFYFFNFSGQDREQQMEEAGADQITLMGVSLIPNYPLEVFYCSLLLFYCSSSYSCGRNLK